MSWGRIDDDFTSHPKVLALGSKQRRWTWLEILTYTWRYESPIVPDGIRAAIPAATNAYLKDCETVGLIDRDDQGRRQVHDWILFTNASVSLKVQHYLLRFPQATANEVVRAVSGKRELVLAEVATQRQNQTTGSPPGSEEPPLSGSLEPPNPVPEVVLARVLTTPTPNDNGEHALGTSAVSPNPSAAVQTKASYGSTQTEARPHDDEAGFFKLPTTALSGVAAIELTEAMRDIDHQTRQMVIAYATKLPAAAFLTAKEDLLEHRTTVRNDAGYVKTILDRMVTEAQYATNGTSATTSSPDDDIPF